jgi:hypothetical protein
VDDVAGPEIMIAKPGKTMTPLAPPSSPGGKKQLGLLKGRIKISHDFNAPLDQDNLDSFEGR